MLKRKLKLKRYMRLLCISLGAILLCIFRCYQIDLVANNDSEQGVSMEKYFVKTSGCQMSATNPYPKNVKQYFGRIQHRKCNGSQLFRSETVRGKNFLVLAMSEREILQTFKVESLAEVNCFSTEVTRYSDHDNVSSFNTTLVLSNQKPLIPVKDGPTIQRIKCLVHDNKLAYHDVHFFLPAAAPRHPPRRTLPNRLSVMILGIDSISHMHFIRMLPLTAAFIENQSHVRFWGYNRVGLNSFPNLIPLLNGLSDEELQLGCHRDGQYFDSCPFLWKHFKAAGYNTSFGEDNKAIGTFTYGQMGFLKQPTDFYLRPVMVEIDKQTRYSLDRKDLIHCSAGRKYADVLHEFIYKLTPHLRRGPHFSFFWETQGVHDYFNYARLLDENYLRLLQHLHKQTILNNTLVLFMADHGLRFGSFRNTYQGMLEESQPFLIALYPQWLEKTFPIAIANLRHNAHSLVTNFDLHTTVKDLTNLKLLRNSNVEHRSAILKGLGSRIPRGISLFLRIPEQRDCYLAGIPSHFCLCNKLYQISSSDKRAQRAALFVVQGINMLIKGHKLCQRLKLEAVRAAYILNQDEASQHFEIKVRVETSPGKGLFEGTTRFTATALALNGAITRTNVYGNQSYCAHDFRIEMFCYCL